MAAISTTIAPIFPVTSFAVTSPVPINSTVKAAARARRRSPTHIFTVTTTITVTGASLATWNPFSELNNHAASIKVPTIKVVPCIISIPGITELNKCKLMLHIHISHSPISAEEVFKVPCSGTRGQTTHVQPCVATVTITLIVARHFALRASELAKRRKP